MTQDSNLGMPKSESNEFVSFIEKSNLIVVKITKDVTCESEINCPVPVSPENYYFQSRQTGEGFRSSAPPDCRVIVN